MSKRSKPGRGRGVDAKGRSRKGNRFVMLEHWLLDTAAYKKLSGSAVKVLLEVYRRYNGSNNGDIGMSERECAHATGLSRETVRKALRDLVELGFVQTTRRGGFDYKRHATTWALTQHLERGEDGYRSFASWKSGCEQPRKIQKPGQETSPHRPRICARRRLSDVLNRANRPRIRAYDRHP